MYSYIRFYYVNEKKKKNNSCWLFVTWHFTMHHVYSAMSCARGGACLFFVLLFLKPFKTNHMSRVFCPSCRARWYFATDSNATAPSVSLNEYAWFNYSTLQSRDVHSYLTVTRGSPSKLFEMMHWSRSGTRVYTSGLRRGHVSASGTWRSVDRIRFSRPTSVLQKAAPIQSTVLRSPRMVTTMTTTLAY